MFSCHTGSAFPEAQEVDSDLQIEGLCQQHMTLPCHIDTLVPNRSVLYKHTTTSYTQFSCRLATNVAL